MDPTQNTGHQQSVPVPQAVQNQQPQYNDPYYYDQPQPSYVESQYPESEYSGYDRQRATTDEGVKGLSAVGYQGPRISYKVKVVNSSPEPICDVRVSVFTPRNTFMVDAYQKIISLLEPNESNTVTFFLRPMGECGKRAISGEVEYYDYYTSSRQKVAVKPREVEVVCPILTPWHLDKEGWKVMTQRLITSTDETSEIPIGVDNLATIVFDAVAEFNMATVAKTKVVDGAITEKVGKFAAKGVKGYGYGARVVVVGGPRAARVFLKCYAENESALTGFHHALIDMIEKRTKVKQYLTDNIVIQHIKGDLIDGDKITIKDSVIHRSEIG